MNLKDELSFLKIERVMVLFVTQPEAKISIKQDFQISKSQSVLEDWVQFFASELNSYIGQTSIYVATWGLTQLLY